MRARPPFHSFLFGLAALGLCFAAALPSVSRGSMAPGSNGPTGRYSLRVEGCPDSIRARFGFDSLATSRLWDGAESLLTPPDYSFSRPCRHARKPIC